MICYYCNFFFQAEDGIRDYKVTGVQTCALPILSLTISLYVDCITPLKTIALLPLPYEPNPILLFSKSIFFLYSNSNKLLNRSEERRVGKECIFSWCV